MDKEAQFEYKCRRCGCLYSYADCDGSLAHELLHLAVCQRDPELKLMAVHHCEDGGAGVSDLQGYKVV